MSKLRRREFKELLIEWKQNFIKKAILERGLPSEKISKHIKSKRVDFNSLRDRRPVIFPVMYVITKSNKKNTLFKDIMKSINKNKNNNLKIVLQNNKENRAKVANALNDVDLIDSKKYNQIVLSSEVDIVIVPEFGDVSSKINKDHVGNTIWSIHDLYHVYLEEEIQFNIQTKFEQNDIYLFHEFIMQALSSKDYPHYFDFEDSEPSLFAFLYLFIIEFDEKTKVFDIEKSNQNIEKLKIDLQNFNLADFITKDEYPYYLKEETFINIESLATLIKQINKHICNILTKKILSKNKTITLGIV